MKEGNSKKLMLRISAFSLVISALRSLFVAMPVHAQLPLERRLCKATGEYVVFAQRRFDGSTDLGSRDDFSDRNNLERAHEHIFFCKDGRIVANTGFGGGPSSSNSSSPEDSSSSSNSSSSSSSSSPQQGGRFTENITDPGIQHYTLIDEEKYNTEIIRSILKELPVNQTYCLIGGNCQDFADGVRQIYWRRMFQGTWNAEGYQCPFGTYHKETINMQINGSSLVATKVDGGDKCVPTGSRTFSGSIPNNISKGNSFSITYVVGNPNNPASGTAPGQLKIVDANTLYSGSSTGEGITFRRAKRRP